MSEQTGPQTATPHPPHPQTVTIYVNNREVVMPRPTATGAQIKSAADIPASFQLFGPDGDPIGDEERVRLHDEDRFTAISGQDVS